eukprot:4677699-Lingulodinium_polyedra.AAC.1
MPAWHIPHRAVAFDDPHSMQKFCVIESPWNPACKVPTNLGRPCYMGGTGRGRWSTRPPALCV